MRGGVPSTDCAGDRLILAREIAMNNEWFRNHILLAVTLQREGGRSLHNAVLEAARLRFRPILMTSFAFILGVFPMAISTGAGANSRRAIGTGVVGGMLSAAVLGVLLIPVCYVAIRRLLGDKLDDPGRGEQASTPMTHP